MGRQHGSIGFNYKKKGKPAGNGVDKAGLKDVQIEKLELEAVLGEKYTIGDDESPAQNMHERHPNRNLNKVDIDKPAYS